MKISIFHLLLLAVLALSCKKDIKPGPQITGFSPTKGSYNNRVSVKGIHFDSLPAKISVTFNGVTAPVESVSDTLIVARVPQNATTGKIMVSIDGKSAVSKDDFVILPGQWVLLTQAIAPDFEGRHENIAFSIGTKAYAGMGYNGGASLNDLWEFDPVTGNWAKKAPCGIDFYAGIAMVINGKAYVGLGKSTSLPCCPAQIFTNQIWEYNPASNTWTRKADFPGAGRWGAFSIGVNNKGYVGMGDAGSGIAYDWWEYDPAADTWTQKAGIPSTAYLFYPAGFAVNDKIYTGIGSYQNARDWYEYNPSANTWTRKADFPGVVTFAAKGFSIGQKGYIAGGGYECWEYDPASNTWTQKAFFDHRAAGATFTLNNKGYYVAGGYVKKDFWQFTPD